MPTSKEHVMVTGGAGMIGSNLVRRLVQMGYKVSVADNLWRGRLEYLTADDGRPVIDFQKDFIHADLARAENCEGLFDTVDYVFHLADVVAGIDYVFNNQGNLFRQNFLINSNVVNEVRKSKVKGYVYVGTACSYPAEKQFGVDAPPLREEDAYPANPESAYGWSKLMGEYEAFLMEQEMGIPVCVPVLHNVYGPPCDFSPERSQAIPALIRKAINFPHKEPFVVWGSGSQGRAFVHTEDVVDGLVKCLEAGLGKGNIQLGPAVCTSIREIAETVVDISGKDIEIVYDTTRPEGDRGRCADYAKAREVLGWEPRVSLRDGLADLYGWISKRM